MLLVLYKSRVKIIRTENILIIQGTYCHTKVADSFFHSNFLELTVPCVGEGLKLANKFRNKVEKGWSSDCNWVLRMMIHQVKEGQF